MIDECSIVDVTHLGNRFLNSIALSQGGLTRISENPKENVSFDMYVMT